MVIRRQIAQVMEVAKMTTVKKRKNAVSCYWRNRRLQMPRSKCFFKRSRDLFVLIAGFLFNMDPLDSIIYDQRDRCTRRAPKKISLHFI